MQRNVINAKLKLKDFFVVLVKIYDIILFFMGKSITIKRNENKKYFKAVYINCIFD